MRLTFSICLFCVLQSFAIGTFSQNVRLSINQKNISVENALQLIEDKTDYYFMYSALVVDIKRTVDVEATNKLVTEILEDIFNGTDTSYKIDGRLVALTKNGEIPQVTQQQKSISGKVSDSSGVSLPGVSVVVKETKTGIITDLDGKYTITKVPENATLMFSFVGMKTQEISVSGKTSINITLVEEAIGIDEVVAVGYGTQKKVNLTGSVGTVNSKALESRPVRSVSQILQGMVPGLNISQSSGGNLDSNPNINIRGIATIGQGSNGSPLILIDGMEGNINALNPQDIENVSVLKDVSASSIYGARAPFGVILITTKKGKEGHVIINYNNNYSSNTPLNVPNVMNSFDFATFINDGLKNSGAGVYFTDARIQQIKDFMAGKITYSTVPNATNPKVWGDYKYAFDNVNWYDAIYRDKGFSQEHNLNVSGGNKAIQYYASGNFLGQDGLMELNSDFFKRYTSTLKLSAQLTDWASLNLSNRFIREDYKRPLELTNDLFQNLARQSWPVLPVYDPNGYLFYGPSPALGLRDGGNYKTQTDWLYQQAQLVLEPVWKKR